MLALSVVDCDVLHCLLMTLGWTKNLSSEREDQGPRSTQTEKSEREEGWPVHASPRILLGLCSSVIPSSIIKRKKMRDSLENLKLLKLLVLATRCRDRKKTAVSSHVCCSSTSYPLLVTSFQNATRRISNGMVVLYLFIDDATHNTSTMNKRASRRWAYRSSLLLQLVLVRTYFF